MQSTNEGRRRERIRAMSKVAMTGRAGLGILVVLFLACLTFVVFGCSRDEPLALGPQTSVPAVETKAVIAGGASRTTKGSGNSAEPTGYFPSGYVNRGADGDGNVMTYEHEHD